MRRRGRAQRLDRLQAVVSAPEAVLLRRLVAEEPPFEPIDWSDVDEPPPPKPSYDEPRAKPLCPKPAVSAPGSGSTTVKSLTLSDSTDPHRFRPPQAAPATSPVFEPRSRTLSSSASCEPQDAQLADALAERILDII